MMIYFFTGILNPVDEFQYWGDLAKRDERAATYVDLFKPISKDFGGLDAMSLQDVMELVDITQDTLDDVWKCIDYDLYPEPRMKHLMDVIGN
jgi:dynein heavy chain 2